VQIDREVPIRFLKAAFQPDDWIAVLLKRHDTGQAIQRVGPLDMVLAPRFQSWLRFKNAHGFSIFVSVNALTPGRRSRTRDAVSAVRHVFLDADHDAVEVVADIHRRQDLPPPSFLIGSSPGRAHVLWRVTGMSVPDVEALQKHLTIELRTDSAATSAAQLTRLPGFLNRKYPPPSAVTLAACSGPHSCRATDFPNVAYSSRATCVVMTRGNRGLRMLERARRYVAATPPAVQGEQGDGATFRLCCRLVGRFGLSDSEAIAVLRDWNQSCAPQWTENDLMIKIKSARRQFTNRS